MSRAPGGSAPAVVPCRGFALVFGVLALPVSGTLLLRGGPLVTFGLALMEGAVRLVASGRIVSGVLSRFGGASSGQRCALLGCSCPLLGKSCVGLVAVHCAIFSTSACRSRRHG